MGWDWWGHVVYTEVPCISYLCQSSCLLHCFCEIGVSLNVQYDKNYSVKLKRWYVWQGSEGHYKRKWMSPEGEVIFTYFCSDLHHFATHITVYFLQCTLLSSNILFASMKCSFFFGVGNIFQCWTLLAHPAIPKKRSRGAGTVPSIVSTAWRPSLLCTSQWIGQKTAHFKFCSQKCFELATVSPHKLQRFILFGKVGNWVPYVMVY